MLLLLLLLLLLLCCFVLQFSLCVLVCGTSRALIVSLCGLRSLFLQYEFCLRINSHI